MKITTKLMLSLVLLCPAMMVAMEGEEIQGKGERIAAMDTHQDFTNPDEQAAAFVQPYEELPLTHDEKGPIPGAHIQLDDAPYMPGNDAGGAAVKKLRTLQNKKSNSWLSWSQKNWLPLATATTSLIWCGYIAYKDKQALPQAFSWTQSKWASIPKFFKPIIKCGTIAGLGLFASKTYNYFFKKPIIANPQHKKFVTHEELKNAVISIVDNYAMESQERILQQLAQTEGQDFVQLSRMMQSNFDNVGGFGTAVTQGGEK